LERTTASMHSWRRTGREIEVPSAIVLFGTFHSAGGECPSVSPSACRIPEASGEHSSGCAQKRRGSFWISPARWSSLKPRSQPRRASRLAWQKSSLLRPDHPFHLRHQTR
jgi:hypothetical protein